MIKEQAGCAGCDCSSQAVPVRPSASNLNAFSKQILTFFGIVFGAVLLVVVIGEWLGLFESFTDSPVKAEGGRW